MARHLVWQTAHLPPTLQEHGSQGQADKWQSSSSLANIARGVNAKLPQQASISYVVPVITYGAEACGGQDEPGRLKSNQ